MPVIAPILLVVLLASVGAAKVFGNSSDSKRPTSLSIGASSDSGDAPFAFAESMKDFSAAESSVGYEIIRPSDCAAEDSSATTIETNAKTGQVYVRYDPAPSTCSLGPGSGNVQVYEFPSLGPNDSGSTPPQAQINETLVGKAVAMGPVASTADISGYTAIVVQGNYEGDCARSPTADEEGCAPAQTNPTGVLMTIGNLNIQVTAPGDWSTRDLLAVVMSIATPNRT